MRGTVTSIFPFGESADPGSEGSQDTPDSFQKFKTPHTHTHIHTCLLSLMRDVFFMGEKHGWRENSGENKHHARSLQTECPEGPEFPAAWSFPAVLSCVGASYPRAGARLQAWNSEPLFSSRSKDCCLQNKLAVDSCQVVLRTGEQSGPRTRSIQVVF